MTAEPRCTIQWPGPAVAHLRTIADQRERALIVQRVEQLATAPEQQGKALLGPLARCRSVRAVGQRYRIVYQVVRRTVVVVIVAVGRRKEGDRADVYALAQKLIRQQLLPSLRPRE
jgi:mRNA interferase RelE/StbE